jgi:TonB family protein
MRGVRPIGRCASLEELANSMEEVLLDYYESHNTSLRLVLSICLILFVPDSQMIAQTNGGEITGVITHSKGFSVAGVTVTIINARTNDLSKTITSEDGTYKLSRLKPGRYYVSVDVPRGFIPPRKKEVNVKKGKRVDLNFKLKTYEVPCYGNDPIIEIQSRVSLTGELLKHVEGSSTVNNLSVGQAVRRVTPAYPEKARLVCVEGAAIVEVVVSESGDVISAKGMAGNSLLLGTAESAAKGWRFTPTLVNGAPVKVIAVIIFDFKLM